MLSYRHAFHAGNHADVLKHLVLVLILESLLKKDKPFTVFDTHAGAGLYQLDDFKALQTEEAKTGILKLMSATKSEIYVPEPVRRYVELCKPYIEKNIYPGSPEIERNLMRSQDKIFLAELHNTEIQILKGNLQSKIFFNDKAKKTPTTLLHTDGFSMLKSHLPPAIKRGLVIVDPSYETENDYTNSMNALPLVIEKWNTAIAALWFPLLMHRQEEIVLLKDTITSKTERILANKEIPWLTAELCVDNTNGKGLFGSGMIIINPPYLLYEQLEESLPFLSKILAENENTWKLRKPD